MKSKNLSAIFALCAAMLVLSACGDKSGSFGGDTSSTPANAAADSVTESVNGRTDDPILPGVSDSTATPGNVTDMPNTDSPTGDGMLGGSDSRDTAPVTTAPSTTAPAVRPPEGK